MLEVDIAPRATGAQWAALNVGGRVFRTTRATLTSEPDSMLARMFSEGWAGYVDGEGCFLLDRSPE